MGLCKECRKVTSLFCYKHRVNVCEGCMVKKHPTCVVQTYLQWLQDCDFDPTCRVCGDNVENGMETIRLPCLHLLHLGCLDKYAKSFPANTAPAGFTCPICTTSVVPARNQAGPVADTARGQLSRLSWARVQLSRPASMPEQDMPAQGGISTGILEAMGEVMAPKSPSALEATGAHSSGISSSSGDAATRRTTLSGEERKPDATALDMGDADDDKYARRPVNTRIARIVTNQLEEAGHFSKSSPGGDDSVLGGLKKTWIIMLILIMVIVAALEYYTSHTRRHRDDNFASSEEAVYGEPE